MTSFNKEERFDLKTQFQPTQPTQGTPDLTRKKPTSKPKKDFEKVMKKKERDDDDKRVHTRKEKVGQKDNKAKENLESDLKKTAKKGGASTAFEGVASREGYIREMTIGKEHPEFMQEQPDIAGVNLNVGIFGTTQVSESDQSQQANSLQRMQQIVDQIVNKIYTLKQGSETSTVLTLRNPPMFEGAQLKITEFKTARGEFNITFSNLSADAKALMDMHLAQNALQRALEQRGYVAHIVVATTQKEEPIATADPGHHGYGKEEHEDQEEGQQKQQEQDQQG